MKRTRVVILVVIATVILLPLIIFGGFIGYAGLTTCYTQHVLRQAAPDAVEYNRQAYETNTSYSYDMCFYKFTQYNAEYTKNWENTSIPGGKTRTIDSGLFVDIITINPTTKCAMVEYHYKSDGAWQK